ncbi:aminopeptidase [Myxococcus stipitatus]|uniref:M1 family aminopeptidase n=1 Tax=Myxococcus stipitatus TaxID=83455 RepID=UPI001F1BB230|nr:M1 family aminopeptidase [Myxococcus stipitatus]MCE9667416.1 aminopeptidase [Myxococcus stipitatus]
MRTLLPCLLVLCLLSGREARADVPPEVQLSLQHLKGAERERAQKALGPLDELPRYRVQLEVDPDAREAKGRVQVEVLARDKPITELYLRVTPNAQGGKRVVVSDARLGKQPIILEQPEPTLYRYRLEEPVPPGAAAVLDVAVRAVAPKGEPPSRMLLGGLGGGASQGGDHGAFSATPDFLSLVGVVPQVPPLDDKGQPWAGPQGIGDLALYAPAHVLASITVPSGWAVHATGAPMGEVPERDGRVRFAFAAGAVRDFPILVSRGYAVSTATVNGVTVESHYAARNKDVGERVLKYATAALTEFERRLGPLPYTHFRVVEAPLSGGAGGMEFPGLITVATSLYRGVADPTELLGGMGNLQGMKELLDALGQQGAGPGPFAQLGVMLERTLEFTVAHEVAHQYFAGLVGSDPVNMPVVDESLAQYAALLYIEWKHGKAAAEKLRKELLVSPYHMYRLSGGEDGRADRPTGDFDNETQYGALVYAKAPMLHHASRKLVGDAAFLQGMRNYVDAYRFKWTCRECFTRELAKASPSHAKQLERLRVRWWNEARGDDDLGLPNLGAVMGTLGGGGGMSVDDLEALDPAVKAMLEEVLPGLLGQ